jgi:hypothetical protein
LYQPRELGDFGQDWPVSGAVVLRHSQCAPSGNKATFLQTMQRWRAGLDRRLSQIDWTPDLAEDIGSGRWFRGLCTMLVLGAAALLSWPHYSAPVSYTHLRAHETM